jgi:hypothetical protein
MMPPGDTGGHHAIDRMPRPGVRLIFGMFAGRRHPRCQFPRGTFGTSRWQLSDKVSLLIVTCRRRVAVRRADCRIAPNRERLKVKPTDCGRIANCQMASLAGHRDRGVSLADAAIAPSSARLISHGLSAANPLTQYLGIAICPLHFVSLGQSLAGSPLARLHHQQPHSARRYGQCGYQSTLRASPFRD